MSENELNFIKEKILEFADKYLDGNIDKIVSFPLTQLAKDRNFGCPGRSFDPDDTEIMRYIYIAVFNQAWPFLTLESIKTAEFRGDTLNTYNTLFGRPDDSSEHPGLDRFSPLEELTAKVEDFHNNHFPTIGNMVVLPNRRYENRTINTYRGCHPQWRDFFDRFLPEALKILNMQKDFDMTLYKLFEENFIYFKRYYNPAGEHNEAGPKSFIENLFLQDYIGSKFHSKALYFWKRNLSVEEYFDEANRYIDFANKVIENRGRKMLAALKEFMSLC